MYDVAMRHGALGGKVTGAGGGGYMIFYCRFDRRHVVVARSSSRRGLTVSEITFDLHGLTTWRSMADGIAELVGSTSRPSTPRLPGALGAAAADRVVDVAEPSSSTRTAAVVRPLRGQRGQRGAGESRRGRVRRRCTRDRVALPALVADRARTVLTALGQRLRLRRGLRPPGRRRTAGRVTSLVGAVDERSVGQRPASAGSRLATRGLTTVALTGGDGRAARGSSRPRADRPVLAHRRDPGGARPLVPHLGRGRRAGPVRRMTS